MNKLTVAVMLGVGLALPLGAMASPGEDVTIRVMQMNENTSENVTRYIQLPDAASDQAVENAQSRDRNRERVRERINQQEPGDTTDSQTAEQERIREMLQERERLMEQEHENMQEHGGDMPGGMDSGGHGPM